MRRLAGFAALWTAAYLGGYGWLSGRGGLSPAWWYIGGTGLAVLALIAIAAGRAARRTLIFSLVVLALAAFVGIMTIGFLLTPAVVAVAIAVITTPAPRRGPAANPPVPRADC